MILHQVISYLQLTWYNIPEDFNIEQMYCENVRLR